MRREIVHRAIEAISEDEENEKGGKILHNPVNIMAQDEMGEAGDLACFDGMFIVM